MTNLERRLQTILFNARANGVEDIRDPALQAEAGYLAHQIEEERVRLKTVRRGRSFDPLSRGRVLAVARRREQRDRKAHMAKTLRAQGFSNPEIARRLDVSRRQVARLCNALPSPDLHRCPNCGQVLPKEP